MALLGPRDGRPATLVGTAAELGHQCRRQPWRGSEQGDVALLVTTEAAWSKASRRAFACRSGTRSRPRP
jgi:hypothetical protein